MAARVQLQPAYLLHRRPYRDTSLLLEVFTPDHGRVGLVARGARSARSPLAALLQPFRPVLLSWWGRGELGTLSDAEPWGGMRALGGRALLDGFYLNELLLRLMARHDPQPAVFELYAATLMGLGDSAAEERLLRVFEARLLAELGYGLILDRAADSGRPLVSERRYCYHLERGPLEAQSCTEGAVPVDGRTLLGLANGELTDRDVLAQAKHLMRAALAPHLGQRPLHSRQLYAEFLRLAGALPPA